MVVWVVGLAIVLLFVRSAEIAWHVHFAGEIWQHEADELMVMGALIAAGTALGLIVRNSRSFFFRLPAFVNSLIVICTLVIGTLVGFAGISYLIAFI